MKAKVLRWLAPLLVFAVAASIGAGVSRAKYSQPQQAPPAKGAPAPGDAAKSAGPPVSKAENDAYKAFYASRSGSSAAQIQLGEDFLKKFPQSHYLAGIYSQLTTAY